MVGVLLWWLTVAFGVDADQTEGVKLASLASFNVEEVLHLQASRLQRADNGRGARAMPDALCYLLRNAIEPSLLSNFLFFAKIVRDIVRVLLLVVARKIVVLAVCLIPAPM